MVTEYWHVENQSGVYRYGKQFMRYYDSKWKDTEWLIDFQIYKGMKIHSLAVYNTAKENPVVS